MSKTIDSDVLDVLRESRFDGSDMFLPSVTLERSLYVKTDKVIKALGGAWARKSKSHVFPGDAADICADAIMTGCYVDAKQLFDYFQTPVDLAERLVRIAGVKPGDRVLEPSAGGGRIAMAAESACVDAANVHCVEIQEGLADDLKRKFAVVVSDDFLNVSPLVFGDKGFDAVVMNPPFSKGRDMAHVRHAYEFLKTGGSLVSVMGTGFTFRTDRKAVEFRDWLDEVGGTIEKLPDGTFKESGTMVNSVVVEVTR